jgi:hypothetical protein
MDDGYNRPREYLEYAPSPRMVHSGPAYGEYTGRRTAFREHERIYGPPPDEMVYAQPREASHGREYAAYPRQARYYDDEDPRSDYRYVREHRSREAGSGRGQSAADRFLEEFEPGPAPAPEPVQRPPTQQPEPKLSASDMEAPEPPPFTSPPPPNAPIVKEPELPLRQPTAPHPRAPSTVSNGSRYEDYHSIGRHIPTPDSGAPPPRRPGPQRRRDRPHEHRMPSRYYRYMSVARDERGPSMSRSQSRRYEEQHRAIVQQETPQPNAEPEYEPSYPREHSIDHVSPDERFYARQMPREYVSVQDRLHPHPYPHPRPHPYSPPRYRYDDTHPVYYDDIGYEVVRVRGEPRPYRPAHARYEQERYEYVPVPAYERERERPMPQRYNSRGEYYYEDRERERALPRRPAPATAMEVEAEPYEQPGPEIKVESVPVPMPPEGP